MLTVQRYWIRFGKELGIGALMLTLASGVGYAASTAAVSGVVRDSQGIAQMGAMVQVLAAGSLSVATAFTDMQGRYRIANLVPGKYQVQATATFFMPATRRNLQLATGMRATVNLTLNMLADPTAWLPAERRKADEPGDDWTWTLRSAANRPILRMLDDGEVVMVSSAVRDGSRGGPTVAHAAVVNGDGGFGGGGIQSVIALDRVTREGSDVVLRADVAAQRPRIGVTPAMEMDAGYARSLGMAGESRTVVSYASHPEMMSAGGSAGLQVMRMATAERMHLGDAIDLEAGALVYAIHTTGDTLTTQPFLRVTVHPGEVWAVRYRLASSRNVQSYEGLDSIATDIPVTAMDHGRSSVESGSHQEIALTRKVGRGLVEATIYRDTVDHTAITGTGTLNSADLVDGGSSGAMVDTATGRFRFLGKGYSSTGLSLMVSQPLNSGLWAALEYASGAALSTRDSMTERLPEVSAGMHPENAVALTGALKGRVLRTGTKVSASYRWQPKHLVAAVNPYESVSNQAYLSFYMRQALRLGDRLPPGLEATIDVTNLLAEGYQPFLSSDGHTLFLAQSSRAIQGGLSFTF